MAPTITFTPNPGNNIILRASADGYTESTEAIDNSTNFGSVDISGRVTSFNTGDPIEGATIEIVSGASYGSVISTADGSYSLTAVVPGGVDSGLVSGIDFALPVLADLSIDVLPTLTELLADGTRTPTAAIGVSGMGKPGSWLKKRHPKGLPPHGLLPGRSAAEVPA